MGNFPTKGFQSLPARAATLMAVATFFYACSGINDSWEVNGGGYIKYQVNESGNRTIELSEEDVEVPYINNRHHYILIKAGVGGSGDAMNIMVNTPSLGENPVVEGYSWFSFEGSDRGVIYGDQSTVDFDQMDDSTWTADLDLYARDCRSGLCSDTLPALHITGRFRYWIPADER